MSSRDGRVQLAYLSDPGREGRQQQDGGGDREEEEAEQVGQVVDALLARSAGVRHVAAGALAGVAQGVAHVAAHHGHAETASAADPKPSCTALPESRTPVPSTASLSTVSCTFRASHASTKRASRVSASRATARPRSFGVSG